MSKFFNPIFIKHNHITKGKKITQSSLLVFAHKDEAKYFEDLHHVTVTGVGKINATKGILYALKYRKYERIIVLGTAGILNHSLSTQDPYPIAEVYQHDLNVNHPILDLSSRKLSDKEPIKLATGDQFLTDTKYAEHLYNNLNTSMVDMELYAYVDICKTYEIPIEAYKIGSDFASDETSHQEWDEIVIEKSKTLRNFYNDYLAK